MQTKIDQLTTTLKHGILPAMATPLQEDGYTVNVEAIKPLVDLLIGAGVSGLFVGGTTGEGILLTPSERRRLHENALAAGGGRVPVILHIGANTTREAAGLAEHAQLLGADAIAAVTPTYYGMHDDALLDYYHAVAAAAPETPLLAYDIPHMAVNGVSPQLMQRLAETTPTLAGLKTSRPDAQMIRQLLDATPSALAVFAGNERIALGSLALGATGLISGLATAVPEPFVALTRAFATGDLAAAREQHRLINSLLDLMPAGARIGAIKAILQQRGISAGPAVPPRPTPVDHALWEEMSRRLN
ncbi:MAG: dihydrodipicolinate synthase family protein [Candidatus Promineifilaceae bacterium]|nr:dihydrodipicolinate synthase family protein [Candidatus Promineifilaceae bacterium]